MYNPEPIDTSSIRLSEELLELKEMIAKNVHEVWALQRINEGWTYGKNKNSELKQTPL